MPVISSQQITSAQQQAQFWSLVRSVVQNEHSSVSSPYRYSYTTHLYEDRTSAVLASMAQSSSASYGPTPWQSTASSLSSGLAGSSQNVITNGNNNGGNASHGHGKTGLNGTGGVDGSQSANIQVLGAHTHSPEPATINAEAPARHPGLAGSMWAPGYRSTSGNSQRSTSGNSKSAGRHPGLQGSMWATPEPATHGSIHDCAPTSVIQAVPTPEQIFNQQNTSMNAAEVAATASQIAQPRLTVATNDGIRRPPTKNEIFGQLKIADCPTNISLTGSNICDPSKDYGPMAVTNTLIAPASVSAAAPVNYSAAAPKVSTASTSPRPHTTDIVARQMIGSALGVRVPKKMDEKSMAIDKALKGKNGGKEIRWVTLNESLGAGEKGLGGIADVEQKENVKLSEAEKVQKERKEWMDSWMKTKKQI